MSHLCDNQAVNVTFRANGSLYRGRIDNFGHGQGWKTLLMNLSALASLLVEHLPQKFLGSGKISCSKEFGEQVSIFHRANSLDCLNPIESASFYSIVHLRLSANTNLIDFRAFFSSGALESL